MKFYHIVKIPFFVFFIYTAYNIINTEKQIQKINIYNAYQNDASRGIFNVNEWKCKLIDVIDKKIKKTNFKKISSMVTGEFIDYYHNNTSEIRKQEVLTYNSKNSFWKNIKNVASNSFDKLKVKGIEFAIRKGSNFLNNKIEENQSKLQEIISRKTSRFITDSLKSKTQAKSFNDECKPKKIILKSTKNLKNKQNQYFYIWWGIFFTVILIFSVIYYKKTALRRTLLLDASLIALILLVLGIILPMMEINATLLNFKFTLFDENISFLNQSLYFRAKSIYDIVVILMPVNPLIAITVLIFSIVFPLLKLIATVILLFSKKPSKSLKWIIGNLGKWSMADVFIIAIFLANLSFQSILSEQLKPLSETKSAEMAVNTSNSNLQIGFYFFLGYVILSMIIAKLTIRYLKDGDK